MLLLKLPKADLATERERQLTTVRANQTAGLTSGRGTNWAPEVVFSPFRACSRPVRLRDVLQKTTHAIQR